MSKFKYVSFFSGIGGFETALNRLGGECVMASEIDKYANQAYELLYGHKTAGDVTKIAAEDVPDHELLVGGFPCQAFSVAGLRRGFEDTRGTMFFEIARVAAVKKPKLMLMENVKGLLSHDKGQTMDTIILALNQLGYAVDFAVLNSKYFGVPQNRERVFIVAARDVAHQEWTLPKKLDVVGKTKQRIAALEGAKTFNFDWPRNSEVTTRLVEILVDDVPEKYYLSEEKTATLIAQLNERSKNAGDPFTIDTRQHIDGVRFYDETAPTLTSTDYKEPKLVASEDIRIVGRLDSINGHDLLKRVYDTEGIAPTIETMQGGNREPKIAVLGRMESDSGQTGLVYDANGISPTHLNQHGNAVTKVAVQMNRSEIFKEVDVSHCLMARDHKGYGNQEMTGIIEGTGCSLRTRAYKGQAQQLEARSDGLSNTITSVEKDSMVLAQEVRPVLTPDRVEKKQNGRRFKDDGEEMFTLTAQDIHGVAINAPVWRIRKLIPMECFRLQGFSDAQFMTLKNAKISDTQLYKMAGNAVTVNVIESIGERLVTML
ncbi:DNA (cytosine-5-)-methyltransferase [Paenibacillus hexagrammi]|uniref:Cytosine-specific methyltransferase n=1 Tax=Paenibacillus hexagrammi TaxID=2908839 RepID=A0ABY3SSF2_9BACL|nr:DNA (cytosine-5-)-methyltransferase [Paenibacillus sp. YPD9-1]UJF36574.1 DNA (cytosine-5-)-methyltransferase [Paenibacillus sp. YPD9-1]